MVRFWPDIYASEQFHRRFCVGTLWNSEVDFQCQTEGKGPHTFGRERVAMPGIQEHGASAISQVLNAPLGNPILVISVETTEVHQI
jgi:hypothetical protein